MKVDLSELRALVAKATPALVDGSASAATLSRMLSDGHKALKVRATDDRFYPDADAALIVALVTAAPALLDAYAERDRLREALEVQAYLSSLYERLWKGGVVRDLAEAIAAVEHTRALLTDHSEKN